MNGPKSWSLAAAIHPDISAAYDAAQEAAAEQIIGWLAAHATARIGPRGGQIQVPVEEIEAVTVRHYTSRAGDPHRHLHLQVNARVRAAGKWYAIHTIGVRDSIEALNGIGHAAMMTDPGFRAVLAEHGFTLDADSGEIVQMREFVGAFSARAAQIEANLDKYEARWRKANPGQEPGPWLRQRWDHQAWNDARPGKITPKDGAELTAAWIAELHALGYRDPAGPVLDVAVRPGELNRDQAVGIVLARLGARRSNWNAADIRGQVEQLISRAGIVTDPAARIELAEDLTARTLAECVPLLDRPGLPEHLRALTSTRVLEVEADLMARLIDRADPTPQPPPVAPDAASVERMHAGQRDAVAVLAGDAGLVVIEGAAGAGKTTTLAAARSAIEAQGHRLVAVTPTLKAAQIASKQLGTKAFSAAWLVHQHGWRWDRHGSWTRLEPGGVDPASGRQYLGPQPSADLEAGDLLLVDEAGMLDQDTARALLTVADQHRVRVALVGDRHQLPAVGRGGVLDLAARFAHPHACAQLQTVHRFTDPDYAALSLAMRTGHDPASVFDALQDKGLVQIHASEADRRDALVDAATHTSAGAVRVLADTNEQVTQLNAAIRERRIRDGHVDDTDTATTRGGQRIGAGDLICTRRNDRELDVANRDTWTITAIDKDSVRVVGERGERILPAEYARSHVQLAYASTVHAAQGETVDAAHLALGEHTGAASAYVAMTRGRHANTVHLVADSLDEARVQWVQTFSRDHADLGPAHAAQQVAADAAIYAPQRLLEQVLEELWAAWTVEADLQEQLATVEQRAEQLRQIITLRADADTAVAPLEAAHEQAQHAAHRARERATQLAAAIDRDTHRHAERLHQAWEQQREAARQAAQTVQVGTGRFGQHRRAVREASQTLMQWGEAWRPVIPTLPADPRQLAGVAASWDGSHITDAIDHAARVLAESNHPDLNDAHATAQQATEHARQAWQDYDTATHSWARQLARHGTLGIIDDPERRLTDTEQQITDLTARHHAAGEHVSALLAEPVLRSQPAERLEDERADWKLDRATDKLMPAAELAVKTLQTFGPDTVARHLQHQPFRDPSDDPTHGISHRPTRGIGI